MVSKKEIIKDLWYKPYVSNHLFTLDSVIDFKQIIPAIYKGTIQRSYFISNGISFFIENSA
jgi:hypothetical protein